MKYPDINLSSMMTEEEFNHFESIFQRLGTECSEVLGVLATGSLFQYKDYKQFQHFPAKKENPYFTVDSAKCRNLGFSKTSDIDVWVTLKDHNLPRDIAETLSQKSIEVMDARQNIDLESWAELCQDEFGMYCKNEDQYHPEWVSRNKGSYWKSRGFQKKVIDSMTTEMGDFCSRFDHFFDISLNNFLEIRAFPESLLNVKLATVNTRKYDRVPIPTWIRSWLTEYNTHVLYSDEGSSISPFKQDGLILGDSIAKHYGIESLSDGELYLRGFQ